MFNLKFMKMKRLMLLQIFIVGIFPSANGMTLNPLSEGKEKKVIFDYKKLQFLEVALIQNYLKENAQETTSVSTLVRIYNTKGELVFEGDSVKEDARSLLLSADLLAELAGLSLYLKD
jgi:hypothetical protein